MTVGDRVRHRTLGAVGTITHLMPCAAAGADTAVVRWDPARWTDDMFGNKTAFIGSITIGTWALVRLSAHERAAEEAQRAGR